MNKKILAFISLFSLTLVLAVYYVMVPFKVSNKNPGADLSVNVTIDEGEESYFASLEVVKDEEYELFLAAQQAIVASSEATNEEKEVALNNIANVKDTMKKERELVSLIKELGYKSAFVQIRDNSIFTVVSKSEATALDAATIMANVMKKCGSEKTVEVKFR